MGMKDGEFGQGVKYCLCQGGSTLKQRDCQVRGEWWGERCGSKEVLHWWCSVHQQCEGEAIISDTTDNRNPPPSHYLFVVLRYVSLAHCSSSSPLKLCFILFSLSSGSSLLFSFLKFSTSQLHLLPPLKCLFAFSVVSPHLNEPDGWMCGAVWSRGCWAWLSCSTIAAPLRRLRYLSSAAPHCVWDTHRMCWRGWWVCEARMSVRMSRWQYRLRVNRV